MFLLECLLWIIPFHLDSCQFKALERLTIHISLKQDSSHVASLCLCPINVLTLELQEFHWSRWINSNIRVFLDWINIVIHLNICNSVLVSVKVISHKEFLSLCYTLNVKPLNLPQGNVTGVNPICGCWPCQPCHIPLLKVKLGWDSNCKWTLPND